MKRLIVPVLVVVSLSVPALAQLEVKASNVQPLSAPPGQPQRPQEPKAKPALKGLERIHYALRQADLKPEQIGGVEGLIETHFSAGAPTESSLDLEKVRAIWKELEDANKAGDKAKIDALTKQLQDMGKAHGEKAETFEGEDEFFGNVNKVLAPEQQALLKDALERLKVNPSGQLRPIDVLRAARKLTLSDKAKADINGLETKFRTDINNRDPSAGTPEERRGKLLDGLIQQVSDALAGDQKPLFERRVRAMRPELGQGLKVMDAAAAPAKPAG
jgi:hypothetical protein